MPQNSYDLVEALSAAPGLTAKETEEISAASCELVEFGQLCDATESRLWWLWEEKGRY